MKYIVLLLALAAALPARAATIGRHPGFIPLHGYGLNLRNPDDLKPPVAALDFAQPETYAGDGSAQFSVHFSQHKLDLTKHFALNASLSVKSMAFTGRANFSYVDNTRYSGNNLNFAFVCTRDYGTTTYTNASVGPQFSEEVNLFRQTNHLSGPALYGAISNRFGTHYIKGHRSVGKVVVIYTFHFDSTTTTRDLTTSLDARYRGGVTTVNFHTDVRSFFEQTASRVSMTYQFYSSDPGRPLLFSTNAITSYADFLAFSDAVVTYCNTQMTPAGGERSEFVVDRIENLRGYCALAGNCIPAPLPGADYDRWMDAYGQLARWDDTLTGWAIDPRRMSWMNTNGQRLVLGMRRDVSNYRRTLEVTARRHFDAGEPLVVPDEIFNYFANFSRIPLPAISGGPGGGDPIPSNSGRIGWINCGPKELVKETPFNYISTFLDGLSANAITPVFYSSGAFASNMNYRATAEPNGAWLQSITQQFLNSPIWTQLQDAQQHCKIGFFLDIVGSGVNADRFSWVLLDDAGGAAESVPYRTPNNSLCSVINEALDLKLRAEVLPASAIDSRATFVVSVTNNGFSPAYGTLAALPIPAGMQVLAVSGSQGQPVTTNGVLVVSNDVVLYQIGPLGYGSAATIWLDLVPLRTGVLTAAMPATVTVGDGLTDSDLSNNSVLPAPLTVVGPRLLAVRTPRHIELSWTSETGRLNLESASPLSTLPAWLGLTNAPLTLGSTRTLHLPTTAASKFFRLRMQPF